MEKQVKLNDISRDIRELVTRFTGTPEEKREKLMEHLLATYQASERELAPQLMLSPVAGVGFVKSVIETIGAVNEVVYNEFDIEPVHIKEFDLITVQTLETVFQKDIDEFLEEMD